MKQSKAFAGSVAFSLLSLAGSVWGQTPFHGVPAQVPGRIQAEDFDLGPEGAAYHLVLGSTPSSSYRGTDVALRASADVGSGYEVALGAGEWVAYTIDVKEAGVYQMAVRGGDFGYTSPPTVHLELSGEDLSGRIVLPDGYYANFSPVWVTGYSQDIVLKPGIQVVRLVCDSPGGYPGFSRTWYNWLELVPVQPRAASVVAGTGVPGFADGPGAQAQFSTNAAALDADLAGNLYVADAGNLRIRKITPQGDVSTLAGTGEAGYVDGPGAQAKFAQIGAASLYFQTWRSLGVADDGTVYVADNDYGTRNERRLRRIMPDGTVSTFWSCAGRISGSDYWSNPDFLAHVSVKSSGEVIFAKVWDGFRAHKDELMQLGADAVPHRLGVFTAAPYGDYWLTDANAAHTSNVLFTAKYANNFGPYPTKLGVFPAAGGSNTLYQVAGLENESLASVTADRRGHVFFIEYPGDWPAAPTVSELLPTGQPHVLYRSATLGGPLCADAQGNVYFFDNHRIVKLFSEPAVVLATIATAGGTITTSLPGPYPSNTVVTVTAVPGAGWSFLGWSGDASGTTPQLEFTMSTHRRVNAAFGAPLNLSKTDGGDVTHFPTLAAYPAGTRITLQAIPQEGYEFTKWSDGDTNLARVVEIAGPLSLKATFTALPRYQVTAAVLGGVGGTVELSPARSDYWRGQAVTVIARPASGYVFQVWLDNVTANPRTLTAAENLALFAVFAPGQQQAPQVVTGVGDHLFRPGDRVELTVAASGSAPLEYSWAHNGKPIALATGPTLLLPFAQPIDAGQYTVTVSNSAGQASSTGQLELQNAPSFRIDARRQSDGSTVVWVEGSPGLGCLIQASSDLQSWQSLVVFTNSMQVGAYLDPPAATVNRRYYRALGLGGR